MSSRPIGDYALLSDCHSAALVSGQGSIDWLCLPRFDSPSVFGRLLDDDAGHWQIRPVGEHETRRRYLDNSLVLETQYESPSGMAMMTDALALGGRDRGHDIGRSAPHSLTRVVEVTSGMMTFVAEYAPRPGYGVFSPKLSAGRGLVAASSEDGHWSLSGPPPAEVRGGTATWLLELMKGDVVAFALRHTEAGRRPPRAAMRRTTRRALTSTVRGWQSWSSLHEGYDGPWRDLVRHSGRVLQALTYAPTGAIIAAPTTSLPETGGGDRNWDYRYAWLRDISMTMSALWVAACPQEAGRFLEWIIEAAGSGAASELQIMYAVTGERDLPERELSHLRGWRGSAPVRIGNAASEQTQLDIYGELLDAVYVLREQIGRPDEAACAFLAGLADAAARRWGETDRGLWELRGEPQHYLHSKLMCWVALDRAVQLAPWLRREQRVPAWERAREQVRAAILTEGWNEQVGAFTQSFGGTALDAAALLLPITGFLPADDARVLATVDAIEQRLAAPCGLLYRFREDDAPAGAVSAEGTFVLCTYWLVQALALSGRVDRAREMFERVTAYTNDVGLLSEEVEPFHGELLGNFPQGLSHIGLITSAWAIDRAERAQAGSSRR